MFSVDCFPLTSSDSDFQFCVKNSLTQAGAETYVLLFLCQIYFCESPKKLFLCKIINSVKSQGTMYFIHSF